MFRSDCELIVSLVFEKEMEFNICGVVNFCEDDIYFFLVGMNVIFNVYCVFFGVCGGFKLVNFGFFYVDIFKIFEKFGFGCVFYGNVFEVDFDDFEVWLKVGECFLGFFCEFLGNLFFICFNFVCICEMVDKYDFVVVVDEIIGIFVNINVFFFVDIVVFSLIKIFLGDCNVMGGSVIFNLNS